jgi:hypothetical protein
MTDLHTLSKAVSQNIQPNAPLSMDVQNGDAEVVLSTTRNSFVGLITKLKNLFGLTSSSQRSAASALIDAVYEKAHANIGDRTQSRLLAARVLASENVRAGKAITANHIIQVEAKLELLTRAQRSIASVTNLEAGLDSWQSPLHQSATEALQSIKAKNNSVLSGDIGQWLENTELASKNPQASVAALGARPLGPNDPRKQVEILAEQQRFKTPVQGADYSRTPRIKELISPEAYASFSARIEEGAKGLLARLDKETVSGGLIDSVAQKFDTDLQLIVDTQVQQLLENVLFESLGSPYDSGIEFEYHYNGKKFHQALAENGGNDAEFDGTGFDETEYNRLLSREVGYLTAVQGKAPTLEEIHVLSKLLLSSYRQTYVIEGRKYEDPLGANDAWHKKLLQVRAQFKTDLAGCQSRIEVEKVQERFVQKRIDLSIECQKMRSKLPGTLHDLRLEHEFVLPLKTEFDKHFLQFK